MKVLMFAAGVGLTIYMAMTGSPPWLVALSAVCDAFMLCCVLK